MPQMETKQVNHVPAANEQRPWPREPGPAKRNLIVRGLDPYVGLIVSLVTMPLGPISPIKRTLVLLWLLYI